MLTNTKSAAELGLTEQELTDQLALVDEILAEVIAEEAEPTVAEQLDALDARAKQGPWTPACGGTEVPFMTRNGFRLLYCFQASTGRHAYLNCETDIILTNEEAEHALGK